MSGYFAPGYFGGSTPLIDATGGIEAAEDIPGSRYFAPGYFGGSTPLIDPGGGVAAAVIGYEPPMTDAAILRWARQALEDSKLFSRVTLGVASKAPTSQDYPEAHVYPVGFTESDQVDPIELTRSVRFAVQLTTLPDEDGDKAITDQDELSNAVVDMILPGPPGTLPGLAKLESGRYLPGLDHLTVESNLRVVSRMLLVFALAYWVEGRSGRFLDD